MIQAKTHQPCPDCGSSDALQINSDGSTKCYSCGKFTPASKSKEISKPSNYIKGKVRAIPERGLTKDVCKKFGYTVSEINGREVHIATYRDKDGNPVWQKVRYTDTKEFFINKLTSKTEGFLYGMHLFNGYNKKLIIVEGEIDCLTVAQVIGNYPVVSIPKGAKDAKNAIKHNLEWIERFDEVVIMFDMDEPGKEAAKECAALLSVGKAKIAELPLKDPNEMLLAGRADELLTATYRTKEFRPDGVITGLDLWEEVNKEVEEGLSYPFPTLSRLTYGVRVPELIVIGAGTGMGKTEFFKEFEYHFIKEHQQNVGIIHLEESTRDTILGLMGKYLNKKIHIPGVECTEEERRKAFEVIAPKAFIYDAFGTTDVDTLTGIIRYLVKGKDCKYIFLDHVTALADGLEGDVNQKMRNIISGLAKLTRELGFTLFCISHLRKTGDKKPHEEGARVHLDDLYGAAALKQWASFVFALERNQQAKDETIRHTTKLRILKDRYTGQATGEIIPIKYDLQTGRLTESDAVTASSFEEFVEEEEEI